MNSQRLFVSVAVTAVLLLGLVAGTAAGQAGAQEPLAAGPAAALSTAFTYQGQLISSGTPVNGSCDFRFRLYDAATTGSQVGPDQVKSAVPVTGGLFTVDLDFGGAAFAGQRRWLEVAVSCPASGSPSHTVVGARQELTTTPYALYATGNWGLNGNAGTAPGTHYLGTSDDQALELKVNGVRALRIEPHATSPNLIGGHINNMVDTGFYGATIGGGGYSASTCGPSGSAPCWNRVQNPYGTVGGGAGNTTFGAYATVGGGMGNTAAGHAAVAGGSNNTAGAYAAVAGGFNNTASGLYAALGGGGINEASGDYATVPGGTYNFAYGDYSFAAGRGARANHDGSFVWGDSTPSVWLDSTANDQFLVRATGGVRLFVSSGAWRIEPHATSPNVIGGYSGNWVTPGVYGAAIGGGGESVSLNRVTDAYGVVAGGANNQAGDNAGSVTDRGYAAVGGGRLNEATGLDATVAGGYDNTASGGAAAVPGGAFNSAAGDNSVAAGRRAKANHQGSFVWGDSTEADIASTASNQFVVRAYGGAKIVRGQSSFAGTNAALQVEQADTSGQAIYATSTGRLKDGAAAYLEATNTAGGIALWAKARGSDTVMLLEQSADAGEFVKFYQTDPSDLRFKVTWDGVTYADGAYTTPAADFAELLPAEAGVAAGDVLVIGPDGKLARSSAPYAAAVAGVHSARPGFLGGAAEDADATGRVPLAIVGVVPVKVSTENGAIRPGDLLTTSATPGHAMRCEGVERCFGRTLGKALEGLKAGTGVIKVLVMLQ